MGVKPLDSGIELEGLAAVCPRLIDEPVEQLSAISVRSILLPRDKVVDVKILAGKKRFEESITGDGADHVVRFQKCQQVSLFLLTRNAVDKFLFAGEVSPQHPHH